MFWLGIKYFRLSFTNFKTRIPIVFTIIGLSMSIGCLIASIALMRGFQSETLRKTLHIHGHAKLYNIRHMSCDILTKAANQPYRPRYIHKIDTHGITGYADPSMLNITFLNKDDLHYILHHYMHSSVIHDESNIIYIGDRLAHELCINIGDSIMITFDINSGKRYRYVVGGIFKIGFYEFDRYQIFIPQSLYNESLAYFRTESTVVYIDNPEDIDQYRDKMRILYPDIGIETWKETHKSISDMFTVHVRGISLLIGLFIIAGIMQSISNIFTLITSRAKDFSILENMGMSKSQKFVLISTYAMCINICNVMCGILFGIIICYVYVYLRNILETYNIYIIDQDAFWISRFNPHLLISDLSIVSACAFLAMTLTSIIATYFITRKSIYKWIRE